MTTRQQLVLLLTTLILAMPVVAQDADTDAGTDAATQAANDAADVWTTIEKQWTASQDGDEDWIDDLLTEDFSGWGKNAPAPRSKASTRLWETFNKTQGRTVEHELYPLSIVVHGDVAVAHYLYTMATEVKKDKVEVSNGRFTDILVRGEEGWRFLSWHGGDDD